MDLFLRHHIYPYSYYISASYFIHTFVKWLTGRLKMADIYHIYHILALKCNQAKVFWAFGIDLEQDMIGNASQMATYSLHSARYGADGPK